MQLVDICRRNTGEIVWDCCEILLELHLFSHLWFEKDEWRLKAAEKLCWDSWAEEECYVSSRLQCWQGCHSYQIQNGLEEEHRAEGTCSDVWSVLKHLNKWRKRCGNRNWVILSHGRNWNNLWVGLRVLTQGVVEWLEDCWTLLWSSHFSCVCLGNPRFFLGIV